MLTDPLLSKTSLGLGKTVGGYVDSFTDSVTSWGNWFSGTKSAPTPEVEMQTFEQGIHELPQPDEELLGGHEGPVEEPDAPWGEDSDLPGELEPGDFDGIAPELEAPPAEFGSPEYIQQLGEREAQMAEEMGLEMGRVEMVELGGEAVVDTGEVMAEVLEGAEIVAEATEATAAGMLGGAALGALGAAAMIGATIGVTKLLGWLKKKKRVVKEKDDDPWMGYVGYFVIGKIWYPMIVDLVSHDHKFVTLEWKDMTGFTRHTSVNRDDERIRFLNPPVRFTVPKYPKVILAKGKTIQFPYYKKFPVGTGVRMKKTGETGTIVRGMVFVPNNPGYNKDTTYDKYRIRTGRTFIYATPNEFDVKRTGPKHGAKGKLGRWLPNRLKPKGVRKAAVRGILKSQVRKDYYTRIKKRAEANKIRAQRKTTDKISQEIAEAEKAKKVLEAKEGVHEAKKNESQMLAHCKDMLAKWKGRTQRAHKALVAVQKETAAKIEGVHEKDVKEREAALQKQLDLFDQMKNNNPPPARGIPVDDNFIPQRPNTATVGRMQKLGYSWDDSVKAFVSEDNHVFNENFNDYQQIFPAKRKHYTLGGIGRRRLVGANSDTAWDFLVNSFFQQPSGGISGRQLGRFGGMRGLKLTHADTHNNAEVNKWKRALYNWVQALGVRESWTQKQMRARWIEFKKFVLDGGDSSISGDPPKGFAYTLQAYMLMCAQGIYRAQLIREQSIDVQNITRDEADTPSLRVRGNVSSTGTVAEPPAKRAKIDPGSEVTHEDTVVIPDRISENLEEWIGNDSLHSKESIASRSRSISRGGSLRAQSEVDYREVGSSGFHTSQLEYSKTSSPTGEVLDKDHFVTIPNYNSKDPGTWIGAVNKVGAPIIRLNTRSRARGYQFNGNALLAGSLASYRDGTKKLARDDPRFGDGTLQANKDEWANHFVSLDCAYQRCWQESQNPRRPWPLNAPPDRPIPMTDDHNAHVFCEEYRITHLLPLMLQTWPDQILNLPFDDNVHEVFYDIVAEREVSFMGKKYPSVMEMFKAELKIGEKKGVDMYKTFGWGLSSDVENIGHYVTGGFMILSPIDILCLQDLVGETNWLAYFSKFVEMQQEDFHEVFVEPHWMFPWMFCWTHMIAEGILQETDQGDGFGRMMNQVDAMRQYMYTRIYSDGDRPANFSLPTFAEWSANPEKPRDRFAQFCWFIASTAGNFRLNMAGTWFPYCAKCQDTNGIVNSTYGMDMSPEEGGKLTGVFLKLTKADCVASVQAQTAHIGRALLPMPIQDEAMMSTAAYEESQTSSARYHKGLSKRLRTALRNQPHKWPAGGGPGSRLSTVMEEVSLGGSGSAFSSVVRARAGEGGSLYDVDLNLSDDVEDFANMSSAPPSNFGKRYRHKEFLDEWYDLRTRLQDVPEVPGFRASPAPPPNTPVPLEDVVQAEDPPFNFWPYLIFGTILIGLAYITEDSLPPAQSYVA